MDILNHTTLERPPCCDIQSQSYGVIPTYILMKKY